jgi:hypothetical protein
MRGWLRGVTVLLGATRVGAVAPLVAPLPLVPVVETGVGTFVGADTGAETPEAPVVPPLPRGVADGLGGAAGVAGVPNVEGVHAQVRLAPTTVARLANIATEMNRVCLRT